MFALLFWLSWWARDIVPSLKPPTVYTQYCRQCIYILLSKTLNNISILQQFRTCTIHYPVDISYDDPQVTTRRLVEPRRGNDCSSRREREIGTCLLFKLCWAELYWTELWWEQMQFKYCSSRSMGQLLNWVITYHGTFAPNESQSTIFKTFVSPSVFFALAPRHIFHHLCFITLFSHIIAVNTHFITYTKPPTVYTQYSRQCTYILQSKTLLTFILTQFCTWFTNVQKYFWN